MSRYSHKPNILQFICSTGLYGAEKWILALAANSDPELVRLDLATSREQGRGKSEILDQYRNHYGHIGESFELPMLHRFDLGVVGRLGRLILERNVDIIHTHGYKSDIIGLLAARKTGVKCLITPHGYANTRDLKLKLFTWLGCKAMKYADMVAPLSEQLIDMARDYGVEDDRIRYIQNGIDLSEIDAPGESTIITDRNEYVKRIGYIGQLIGRKNVFDILDTFALLKSRRNNIELILIGDGELRKELESHVEKIGCAENIRFLGFREDRLEELKKFDLLVMTSKQEGIPRCIMEAMAMGVPVAAYDIPGIDQLIRHEKTGLLAPLGDTESLAAQWERLLYDDSLASTLVENARSLVQRDFSAKRMAEEYLDLYRGLMQPTESIARIS